MFFPNFHAVYYYVRFILLYNLKGIITAWMALIMRVSLHNLCRLPHIRVQNQLNLSTKESLNDARITKMNSVVFLYCPYWFFIKKLSLKSRIFLFNRESSPLFHWKFPFYFFVNGDKSDSSLLSSPTASVYFWAISTQKLKNLAFSQQWKNIGMFVCTTNCSPQLLRDVSIMMRTR